MSAEIREKVKTHGEIALATYPILPEYQGKTDREIFALLQNEKPRDQRVADNIICTAGLNIMLATIMWACVEDQNTNMGSPFTQYQMAPIEAAVGTGTFPVTVADTDTGLANIVAEAQYVMAASITNASAGVDGYLTWSFLISPGGGDDVYIWAPSINITEAGIFVQAPWLNTPFGNGALLDHCALGAPITWYDTELMTLVVTFSFGSV
jgi:hypothetical protein